MTSPEVTGWRDRKSMKTHCIEVKIMSFLFDLISRMIYLHSGHVRRLSDVTPSILLTNPSAVRITTFSVCVNDTFVKDETILFYTWNHFDTFLFQISLKIIRRYHIGGTAMIQWVLQFSQILSFMV